MKSIKMTNVLELRHELGMSRADFWAMVGVTPKCGGRYEQGQAIPRSVQILLHLAHVEKVDIGRLDKDDIQVLKYLKGTDPGRLEQLKQKTSASHPPVIFPDSPLKSRPLCRTPLEMNPKADTIQTMLSSRRYYSIGEVVEFCGVPHHTLRYWEQVFRQLRPRRRGNRRYYREHDILLILRICELVYDYGVTTRGATLWLEAEISGVDLSLAQQCSSPLVLPSRQSHG